MTSHSLPTHTERCFISSKFISTLRALCVCPHSTNIIKIVSNAPKQRHRKIHFVTGSFCFASKCLIFFLGYIVLLFPFSELCCRCNIQESVSRQRRLSMRSTWKWFIFKTKIVSVELFWWIHWHVISISFLEMVLQNSCTNDGHTSLFHWLFHFVHINRFVMIYLLVVFIYFHFFTLWFWLLMLTPLRMEKCSSIACLQNGLSQHCHCHAKSTQNGIFAK